MTVEKWELDPQVVDIQRAHHEADRAKEQSALALASLTIEATLVLKDLLQDPDPQVRARAVDLIYSRTIPKVAAKHLEEHGEVVDSADVAALRESITAEVKRIKDGQ